MQNTSQGIAARAGAILMAPVGWLARAFDPPLRALQRLTGLNGMAAFFLAPNMLVFGIFVLFPLVINFAYSMTGGGALFLGDRTFVGAEQYQRLFTCGSYLRPEELHRGPVLDRGLEHPGLRRAAGGADARRGADHRACPQPRYARPQLLARRLLLPRPAVAGRGRPHLALDPAAAGPAQSHAVRNGRNPGQLAGGAPMGLHGVDHGVGLGACRLLCADPSGRPSGHSEGPLRGRRDGRHAAVSRLLAHHPALARRPTFWSCWCSCLSAPCRSSTRSMC